MFSFAPQFFYAGMSRSDEHAVPRGMRPNFVSVNEQRAIASGLRPSEWRAALLSPAEFITAMEIVPLGTFIASEDGLEHAGRSVERGLRVSISSRQGESGTSWSRRWLPDGKCNSPNQKMLAACILNMSRDSKMEVPIESCCGIYLGGRKGVD